MESSSESTSRETTPESDESEDEDDNGEDEDEEVAEQDDENPLMTDIENVPGKPIVQRGIAELAEQYSHYFAEYTNPNVSQHTFLAWKLILTQIIFADFRKSYQPVY